MQRMVSRKYIKIRYLSHRLIAHECSFILTVRHLGIGIPWQSSAVLGEHAPSLFLIPTSLKPTDHHFMHFLLLF